MPPVRQRYVNQVTEAADLRAVDEQHMQNLLQSAQLQSNIYNQDIEPEHETEYACRCGACQYKWAKRNRMRTHDIWSKAVRYPGEKNYNDIYGGNSSGMAGSGLFLRNPYQAKVVSPYGPWGARSGYYYRSSPRPDYHEMAIHQTIELNRQLNDQAQKAIDAAEPKEDIWGDHADLPLDFSQLSLEAPPAPQPRSKQPMSTEDEELERALQESLQDSKPPVSSAEDEELERAIQASLGEGSSTGVVNGDRRNEYPDEKAIRTSASTGEKNGRSRDEKRDPDQQQFAPPPGPPPLFSRGSSTTTSSSVAPKKAGTFARLFGSSEIKQQHKAHVQKESYRALVTSILQEEAGRWPDAEWRRIVAQYQVKTGMASKIAHLRQHQPIQYLHLLRAGYFEPIPFEWADLASNPLKFSIEAAGGWRGITPAWRGYEDTAEERLYWVLNHREGSVGMRMKPDFISEMNMARDRMARAVEPPPQYSSPDDVCHIQHTSKGYSRQVMPAQFMPFDRPEVATDDTMILLDVSGSMDFDPLRPVYQKYLVTSWAPSIQPKNKDLAQAIIRRFTDAMTNHDHLSSNAGYDLVTFSTHAQYIGRLTHQNFNQVYSKVRIGGGTRVMTGWQKVKQLHFEKHRESAVWHPVYGWQAGPETPMLRLLLLLDGEAQDMDEFELDLLGLSWAHVTIFLIGVDGCPHHHRHANELQRISDVNHHVSFVDAQGNTPERFVTHELLKRHLGINVSMAQFQAMEQLPAYSE